MLLFLFQANILGLTHSSMVCYMPVFQPCDPVWFPEAWHFLDTLILLVLLLVQEYFWSACSFRIVLPKTHAPDSQPPHFCPDHSCLVSHIVPCTRPVYVESSFQTIYSGIRNKSTALNLWCCTTLEVGVVFLELFRNIWGDYIDALFF